MFYVDTSEGIVRLPSRDAVEALADRVGADLPYSRTHSDDPPEGSGHRWHVHNDSWFDYEFETLTRENWRG